MSEKFNHHHESDPSDKAALDAQFNEKMAEVRQTVPSMANAPAAVVFGYTLAANKDLAEKLQQYEDSSVTLLAEPLAITANNKSLALIDETAPKPEATIAPVQPDFTPKQPLGPDDILDADIAWEDNGNVGPASRANETDAYGNPVHHEREWARPTGQEQYNPYSNPDPNFVGFAELPQYGTNPDEKTDDEPTTENEKAELSKEMNERIALLTDYYAKLTAHDRNSSFSAGRYARDPQSSVARLLHKFKPFAKLRESLADRGNNLESAQRMDKARESYESILAQAKQELTADATEKELTEQQIKIELAKLDGQVDTLLEARILFHRTENSKKAGRITNWWVNRPDSISGKAQKATAIALVGLVAGTAGAIAAPVAVASILGGLTGGIAGGAAARGINRRRANAVVNSRDANGKKIKGTETIAQAQARENRAEKQAILDNYTQRVENGEQLEDTNSKALIDFTEGKTTAEVRANRKRIRSARALGAIGFGALSGGLLHGVLHDNTPDAPKASFADTKPEAPEVPATPAAPAEVPHFNGENFVVERGHGYTQELVDFFKANGHQLSSTQSFELHKAIVNQFGEDYINGTGIYHQGADIRLQTPTGNASWAKGVAEFADKWRVAHGIK